MTISKTKRIIATTILSIMFTASASAKGRYAKVVEVEPIYRYVKISTPREVCSAPIHHNRHRSGSTVAGAVIGGTLGHVAGKNSRNRGVATVAGVLIGSVIGHELGERHHSGNYVSNRHSTRQYQQNCVTSYKRIRKVKQLEGYDVTYRFRGQYYQTFMDEMPGKRIYIAGKRRNNRHHDDYAYQDYKHSSRSAFQY